MCRLAISFTLSELSCSNIWFKADTLSNLIRTIYINKTISNRAAFSCWRQIESVNMNILRVVFLLIGFLVATEAIGDIFLRRIYASSGLYGSGNKNGGQRNSNINFQTTRKPTKAPRGRSFKEICRAVNPAPYSFPNKIPFPSVPIC